MKVATLVARVLKKACGMLNILGQGMGYKSWDVTLLKTD